MVVRGRSRSNSLEGPVATVPESGKGQKLPIGGLTVEAYAGVNLKCNPRDLPHQPQASNCSTSTSISSRQEWGQTGIGMRESTKVSEPKAATHPVLPPNAHMVPSPLSPLSLLSSPRAAVATAGLMSPQHQSLIINPPSMSRDVISPLHKKENEPPAPHSSSRTSFPQSTSSCPPRRPAPPVIVTSVLDLLKGACTLPQDAFSCHPASAADELVDDYYYFFHGGINRNRENDGTVDSIDDDEEMQMRRLGSWSTMETLGTSASDMTLETWMSQYPQVQVDDDGHAIDPILIERRIAAARDKKQQARKSQRVVKFEYPPVSSLRQCPRHDPQDLPELFFTEEELEIFENDRESTYTADDIEIVAISSKSSDSCDRRQGPSQPLGASILESTNPHTNHSPMHRSYSGGGAFGGFGNYIATPRKWSKKRINSQREDPLLSNRKPANGNPTIDRRTQKPERLIKSVQIFLRERSVG